MQRHVPEIQCAKTGRLDQPGCVGLGDDVHVGNGPRIGFDRKEQLQGRVAFPEHRGVPMVIGKFARGIPECFNIPATSSLTPSPAWRDAVCGFFPCAICNEAPSQAPKISHAMATAYQWSGLGARDLCRMITFATRHQRRLAFSSQPGKIGRTG
jgi:hypothetical protein